jgi:hypothetical protein
MMIYSNNQPELLKGALIQSALDIVTQEFIKSLSKEEKLQFLFFILSIKDNV